MGRRAILHALLRRNGKSLPRATGLGVLICLSAFGQCNGDGLKPYGNRCEGTTGRQNGLNDFTFLALHHHVDHFSKGATLHVGFFVPNLTPELLRTIFVEGLEIKDTFHYWMNSRPFDVTGGFYNVFEPWPTNVVIDTLPVGAENLGVRAGYVRPNGSRVYLPVDVYQNKANFAEHSYKLSFALGDSDIQRLAVSVTDATGRSISSAFIICNIKQNPNCLRYPSGSSQDVDIDLSSAIEGEYRVTLTGHVPKSRGIVSLPTLTLYHHVAGTNAQ